MIIKSLKRNIYKEYVCPAKFQINNYIEISHVNL